MNLKWQSNLQLFLSFLMVLSISNGLLGSQEVQAVEASNVSDISVSSQTYSVAPTPENLVVNPGFESGDTGWEFWDGASSVVSNNANSGTNSVVVSAGNTGFAQNITTGVAENETYYFEVYGKVESGQDGRIFVTCRDSNNQDLYTTSMKNFVIASTDYKLRSAIFTAPPGTVKIQIWTWTNHPTGNYYLDDFVLRKHSGPTPTDNPYPAPPVLPPAEHPRLFVRATDLDEIRSRLAHAEVKDAWEHMLDAAGQSFTGELPAPNSKEKNNMDNVIMKTIQAKALLYLLQADEPSGQQAVSMMTNYLNTVVFPHHDYRPIGEALTLGSIVYDWCYPLMTASQRSHFIQRFESIAEGMEIGYPAIEQGAVVGHGSEAQLMRDQLSVGIAVYDENPAIYNLVAGRFFAEYVEPRNYVYPSNAQSQGDSYGPYRYQWDVFASWIFKRMGAGDVFNSDQGMTPYEWIYARRPDGQLMRNGDTFQSQRPFGEYWSEPMPNMLPASYYHDPFLKNEFLRQNSYNKSAKDDLWVILLDDPQLGTMNEQTLPLTKYFPEPSGQMTARTSWRGGVQSSTVVATMKVGTTMFTNHQHMDAGQFQLYYKGGLAIDSGIYEGTMGGYFDSHDLNYNKRTIAHNTMLVYDPNETFPAGSNDGGQRFLYEEPATMQELLNPTNNYEVADVVKHQLGPDAVTPDYSYIKGNLTKAYTSKMEDFKRSFVFLNLKNDDHPAALVVFDKVTSADANFKKTWLLHSENEPHISGDTVTLERTEKGYNGKLVNRTLLPASNNAEITKIGGTDKEFFVNGVNYPQKPWSEDSTEAGAWRVEVSPKANAETDVFLNVMQVMDAVDGPQPLATESIVSNEMVGVKIEDRAVLFSKSGVDITNTASFELPVSNKDVRVLVTDLSTGYWTVTKAGETASAEYEVTPDEGTLYFATTGGTYTLQHSPTRTLSVPIAIVTLPVQAEKDAVVMQVNGVDFAFNSELALSDSQVIIPYERLAAELGLRTNLQGSTLTMSRRGTTVEMTISSNVITINGQSATLQTPVTLRNGVVYIPLEVASITNWAVVKWDEFSLKAKVFSILPVTEYKVVEIDSSTTADVALQATDGDLNTVWTDNVPGAYLVYDLGETRKFDHIDLAWLNGQDRYYQYELLTSPDGSNWTSRYAGESLGSNDTYEAMYFAPVSARFVKLIGNGYRSDLGGSGEVSLKEMRIATPYYKVEAVRSSRGKGEEAIDGTLGTMWTAEDKGSWIEFDLGASYTVAGLGSSWYVGEEHFFDVWVSDDQKQWTTVFQGSNSGTTRGMEDIFFTPIGARYVRVVGKGDWNSIWEAVLYKPGVSNNANLSGLNVDSGALNEDFASGTKSYTQNVANRVTSIKVTPKLEDTSARVKVNGIAVASGQASQPISLGVGLNTFEVVVTAEDSTMNTYTIKVTRMAGHTTEGEVSSGGLASKDTNLSTMNLVADGKTLGLSPAFSPDIVQYTGETDAEWIELQLAATDSKAVVKLKDETIGSVKRVPLLIGDNKLIVSVKAEDGSTKTYTLSIKRNAAKDPSIPTLACSITDIEHHWAKLDICKAAALGIVEGVVNNYDPDGQVTRTEFIVMLLKTLQLSTAKESALSSFTDSSSIPEWGRSAIQTAAAMGLIEGYSDGTFRPQEHINRLEMAVIISRAMKLEKGTTQQAIADYNQIPGWAKSYVEAVYEHGLLEGAAGNRFVPYGVTTRAESAVIMLRIWNKLH
ncbi:S-layer homology domain-containing protein [Paenibacillus sp. HWE-109]|uniref:heparin/heparin-sulfate lyase HepB n=1 Tax=Paenibacillus sp. HWE-109 TaxID=1306526 RepID=UPI001EDDD288|nr:heparin/heparin-sulfate lyase HepB [Paenibacillus sp. HWE-109]UKS30893.1 S-layer homology domain-containing protein [Paenibacillus sp. HWE-109]